MPNLRLGVTLFFILSAFSLLYSNTRIVGTRGWVTIYLIKRLFRIAPLFYAMLALYCGWAAYYGTHVEPANVLANLLFTFGFVPEWHRSIVWAGWTIGVEMPFYACVPLILIGIRKPLHAWILVAATGVISIASRLAIGYTGHFPPDLPEMALSSNLVVFALGVLVFHLMPQHFPPRWLCPMLALVSVGGLLLLSIDVLAPIDSHGYLNLLLFAVPLATLCAWQAIAPSRWLASGPMQWLGERSFSLYLLHPFIVFQLWQAGAYATIDRLVRPWIGDWGFLICAAATLAVVVAATALSYRLMERPGQLLGSLLARRLFEPAAHTAPALPAAPAIHSQLSAVEAERR